MKFKVGDKVRVKEGVEDYGGLEGTVASFDTTDFPVGVELDDYSELGFTEDELEAVE